MAVPSLPDAIVIDIPDPSLVVLVGAAGAGKTTFAARHFAPDEVLSSDAFRAVIAGDPADQTATKPAFAALHRALATHMLRRQLTVIDATNVQPHARRALVSRAVRAGIPAVAIVLDLPRDVVLARNAARTAGAVVPDAAVLAQLDALAGAPPDGQVPWQGFVTVTRLGTPAEIDAVVVRRLVTR